MPSIPLDVVELIIDALVQVEDDPSLPATKACSLACYDFSVVCRKRIFAHIVVNQRNNMYTPPPKFGWQHRATTATFEELLRKSPEIVDHIHSLDYSVTPDDLNHLEVLGQILIKMTQLKSFTIRCFGFKWNNTPQLRPALLHILDLPTLVDFNLDGITGFYLEDLSRPKNLEEFGFDSVETSKFPFASPDLPVKLRSMDIGSFCSATVFEICAKKCTNGQPFLDLATLQELTIRWFSDEDVDASFFLLSHCNALTSLRYYAADGPDADELSFQDLSSILALSSATRTLKYLEAHTLYALGGSLGVYNGLADELAKMANNNVIEQIKIEIFIQMMSDCDRGDEWGALDRALASGWRYLRRCSVIVVFIGNSPVVSGLEEALLHVGKTRFPRLSANRDVLFEFILQKELVPDSLINNVRL
ncbi:hypothetical protein BDN70DRAFT_995229 [Pholiota conissans]|uniref:Uncharacterized protein n=1 Tax=Pholiota conissans TaxID=109636 RepID=A0A9P6CYA2_9AGAR|nr:hypothetical protein BDN70DRAFT_995229 [Pholiota conissans]